MRLRPLLSRPRRGVQQHGIALRWRSEARAVEPEIRSALRRKPKRQAAEDAVALHRMEVAADVVAYVIEHRGQRFADACGVVAVTPPVREAGDDGGTQQALAIHDLVVALRPDGAQAAGCLLYTSDAADE